MFNSVWETLFWGAIFVIIYPYFIYPAMLALASALYGKPVRKGAYEPDVTLIITAFNEAEFIEEKIKNSLRLQYPPEKLQILVTSDGSTDGTNEKIRRFSSRGVEANLLPFRHGKMAAILESIPKAKGEIVIFSDATAMYDPGSVRAFVRNFADPEVGGVSGTLRLIGGSDPSLREGEGVYWRYETFLRRKESSIASTIIAPGSIYAIRKALFTAPPEDTIADDFAVTLAIIEKGYRMVWDEEASATERVSITLSDEFARKCRIVAGGIQTLLRYGHLLAPSRGFLAFELISHKLLRWLVPFAMGAAMAANMPVLRQHPVYSAAFALQAAFYLLALLGLILERGRHRSKPAAIAFHFCAINLAAVIGWYRQFTHSQSSLWAKTAK